jgi:mycoredoxin
MAGEIVVYGSDWCPYTHRALNQLDRLGVPYRYIEVDDDPAAEQRIAAWNNGRSIRPTITIGEDIFVNPGPVILDAALKNHGYLSHGS